MPIEVYNNYMLVPHNDDKLQFAVRMYFISTEQVSEKVGKKWHTFTQTNLLYIKDNDGNLLIPRGLEFLVDKKLLVNKERPKEIPESDLLQDSSYVSNILGDPDVILREEDQVTAIRKMDVMRRGLIQLPTGAGKTECMAGLLKCIERRCGYYPQTLILEPTLLLVNGTVKRFKKYGIPVYNYSEERKFIPGQVAVTHPMSLMNDLDNDPDLLNNLKIIIGDEGHHFQATTWHTPMLSMPNIEYQLAVSALAIDPKKLPIKNLCDLSYDEALIVGATGNVLVSVPTSYYIEKRILATPVLFRLFNSACEQLDNDNNYNWHDTRRNRLESTTRIGLIARTSCFFSHYNRKSLVLVSTKSWAFKVLEMISELGFSHLCKISFGSGEFWKWDPITNEPIYDDSNVMSQFESGEVKILIGTSHIYEGADVPNLDVVIAAWLGRNTRIQIQGIGRGLRRSKTGKYAYLIDFTDHGDSTLASQSDERMNKYTEYIGVPSNLIFDSITFSELKEVFVRLENIKE